MAGATPGPGDHGADAPGTEPAADAPRGGWRMPALVVLVALVAGAGGLVAGSLGTGHGPVPPPVRDLLAATESGRALLLKIDRATEPAGPPGLEVVDVGDPLPALALAMRQPDGTLAERVLAADGRPRLLNYWASWCGPCIEEMPLLDAWAAEQGPNGVEVIGIALDEREAVDAFLQRVPVGYAIAIEASGPRDSSVRLGNTRGVLPFTVMIDADGRVMERHVGIVTPTLLQRWADEAR